MAVRAHALAVGSSADLAHTNPARSFEQDAVQWLSNDDERAVALAEGLDRWTWRMLASWGAALAQGWAADEVSPLDAVKICRRAWRRHRMPTRTA